MGVARQYCGRLGKVANCQGGMFLAYVSPLGRALVDKGCICPQLDLRPGPVCRRVCRRNRSKTELALEMLERVQERGHLRAGWVAGDDAFGMSPSFREGLAALGMRAGRSVRHYGVALPCLDQSGVSGIRAPPQTQAARRSAADHGAAQRRTAGGGLAGDYGGRGKPGAAQLPVQRPEGATDQEAQARRGICGPSTAGTWTAANPATTCPMLPRIPLGDPGIRGRVQVAY